MNPKWISLSLITLLFVVMGLKSIKISLFEWLKEAYEPAFISLSETPLFSISVSLIILAIAFSNTFSWKASETRLTWLQIIDSALWLVTIPWGVLMAQRLITGGLDVNLP